jgi:hypothetical protein
MSEVEQKQRQTQGAYTIETNFLSPLIPVDVSLELLVRKISKPFFSHFHPHLNSVVKNNPEDTAK